MSNFWNKFLVTFGLALCVTSAFAQPKFNSPYSRIGLGDFFNPNFASLNGMADLSAALHDPYHINVQNPASLAHLKATAFEVGLRAKYGSLQSDDETTGVWSGNLAYLSLGFPLRNQLNEVLDRKKSKFNFGMNFALVPYTTVGYTIQTSEIREDIQRVQYNFEGTGGTYKLYWGNGVKYKDFSFGVNLGYLFGKLARQQEVRFDSLEASYRDNLIDDLSISGFVWNAGIQYDLVFKKKKSDGTMEPTGKQITFGLYGNTATNFSTRTSQVYTRFNPVYNNIDTIRNEPLVRGSGKLPLELSMGVIYRTGSKFRGGINYSYANWSKYENEGTQDALLKNTSRISLGGEFIPDITSYNSYLRRMRYRFGFFYGTDPRSDGFNEQLTNYGITIGLGFPIILPRQQRSFVNLAFEVGQFGTEQSLQETYGKLTLGFTLNDDTWFFKRKFY